MNIHYTDSLAGFSAESLPDGFFQGWGNAPSRAQHWAILQGSYRVWLAVVADTQQIVGFINAISDGVLTAFIPLLEVLPAYQGQGIGSELTRRMLVSLAHLYAVDLICDADVQPFYERLGLLPYTGMIQRNYRVLARPK
jgi:ribosomal protein S18 acetylase RimI-like enzyme